MTPKSLLRHKLSTSVLDDLSGGHFQVVIDDTEGVRPGNVQRVVLCSGKVYYDLLEERRRQERSDVALIRIEQLYPFPEAQLSALLKRRYKTVKSVVWCQEEPKNQGAWYQVYHHLTHCIGRDQTLSYAGRDPLASPAVGYAKVHFEQQRRLVADALGKVHR
jgi:2-oxoglutarate dehydrogenase E1 component